MDPLFKIIDVLLENNEKVGSSLQNHRFVLKSNEKVKQHPSNTLIYLKRVKRQVVFLQDSSICAQK
jgi:hypothetical protein